MPGLVIDFWHSESDLGAVFKTTQREVPRTMAPPLPDSVSGRCIYMMNISLYLGSSGEGHIVRKIFRI